MPPHRNANQSAQNDEVYPTHGMRTRNGALTLKPVPTLGVPSSPNQST